MELREKIAEAVQKRADDFDGIYSYEAGEIADAILAIPEIAEALEYSERMSKHLAKMMAGDISKLPIKAYRPPNA